MEKEALEEAIQEDAELKQEQNTNSPKYITAEINKLLSSRSSLRIELEQGLTQIENIGKRSIVVTLCTQPPNAIIEEKVQKMSQLFTLIPQNANWRRK